jgi:adenylate cyclase
VGSRGWAHLLLSVNELNYLMITGTKAEPTVKEPSAVTKGVVLLIDDHKLIRTILSRPLLADGYAILEAENGEEGLKLAVECNPDVIILDIMMPGVDGFEVCRRLKSQSATKDIPVLVVTALSAHEKLLEGIEAGASDFLTKPVDLHEVRLRVRNATKAKQLLNALEKERGNSERLLLNVLPASIAARMKQGESPIVDMHQEASVLIAELVGLNGLIDNISPDQVVLLLDEIHSAFDALAQKHGVWRFKSLGDRYMVVAGTPEERHDHAATLADLAFELRAYIERFNSENLLSIQLKLCISTGPVVAGVIGSKGLAYDVWGTAVKTAWELNSLVCGPEILVTASTWERLRDEQAFVCESLKIFNSTVFVLKPAKTAIPASPKIPTVSV